MAVDLESCRVGWSFHVPTYRLAVMVEQNEIRHFDQAEVDS